MLDQEKILHFLQATGPTLPSKVAKIINTDTLIASAHLSDLASQRKIKISSLKIGGSPLYYLPGHEDQLYKFAQGNTNAKDYQVLETLKEDRLLREQNLDLLSKVALRNLKDFAVPLHVTVNGQKELFWKWHLMSDEETNSRIKAALFGNLEAATETVAQQEAQSAPTPARELQPVQAQPVMEAVSRESKDKADPDLDGQTTLQGLETYGEQEHSKKDKKLPLPTIKPRGRPRKKVPEADDFVLMLENFFAASEIKVTEKEVVRNNAEVDLLIKVPSVVGEITYFCKAKNKARCDEKDLSSAYMEAQIKKLPLLFLYKKEVTKKAQEMLDSGAFQNVILKRWE